MLEKGALARGCIALLSASLMACGGGENGAPQGGGGTPPTSGSGNGAAPAAGKPSGGGNGGNGGSNGGNGGNGGDGATPIGGGQSSAADLARKLGRPAQFLIGMGNDLPEDYQWEKSGVHRLGAPLDLHYIYLVSGWQDWNPGGYFPQIIGDVDKAKGVTPMSSVYAITGQGENNFDVLVDDAYMTPYWQAAKLLMERYAELGVPALVHLEPDFWAYAQQKSGGDPSKVPVHLSPECSDLPADLSGMARCWFKLARAHAPQVVIGLHASEWAAGSGTEVGEFLKKLGAAESDVVIIDMLDRDAGCFEDGQLDVCQRDGEFYLDETNQTSPNFSERLSFAKQVGDTTGKPILWWQIPFGVPSETPGGTPGHFRDNKVRYIFNHIQEFVDAGGVGVTFGVGAAQQTTPDTDGGQFQAAVQAYYADPVPLP